MPIDFDDSKWPIVTHCMRGVSDDDDITQHIDFMAKYLGRQEPHILIIDGREGKSMKAQHRTWIADFLKKNKENGLM